MFTTDYKNILRGSATRFTESIIYKPIKGEKFWILFLDDERYPVEPDCMLARTSFDAIRFTSDWGIPIEMRLDHDLGGDDTAMVYLDWLERKLDSGVLYFPEGFSFSVHSQNPIGAASIRNRMESLLKYF